MKILYIITQGECGGAQKNVVDLAVGMREAGHGVVVATGRQDTVASRWLFDELRAAGFRTALPTRLLGARPTGRPATSPDLLIIPALRREVRPLADIFACIQIIRLVRKLQPDIVHLHSSKAGSIGAVAAKLAFVGVKVVYTVHGFVTTEPLPTLTKTFYRISEFIASFFRDLVITVSARDEAVGQAQNLIHSRSVVIYNGVDQAKKAGILPFSQAREVLGRLLPADVTALASNRRAVGVVAGLYPTKGLVYLLEAVKLIRSIAAERDEIRQVPVIIIGDGPLRSALEAKARELDITDQVFFVGAVDDAYRYLAAFDLIVLPSVKEGFPYVLLEALLAGRPFIASRVGGISELADMLPDGVAHLVPSADPRALAAAMVKFFHESSPSSIRLPELFSIEHMRAATFAEYARLLA